MKRAPTHTGCWNCKSLKIGCDRGHPACQNCLQSKKKCLGYNFRLTWPRTSEARKAVVKRHQILLPSKQKHLPSRRIQFINTSTWDLDLHNEVVNTGRYKRQVNLGHLFPPLLPLTMSTPWGVLEVGDQMLLSYYEKTLSRMVTSIDDDRNGFRHVLIKMALSNASESSAAVLQAILAFSAYHLSGSQAGIKHSFAAISALSYSMRFSTEPRDRYFQLAASMVLMTYGVSVVLCFTSHSPFHLSISATVFWHLGDHS